MGGRMKISLLVAVLVCSQAMCNTPPAWSEQPKPGKFKLEWGKTPIPWGKPRESGGCLIVAARCEEARKQLAGLLENPGVNEAAQIKDILSLDISISCDTTEGVIVCIPCIDEDRSLRALQLLRKRDSKHFELLGFGCRCRRAE